MARFINDEDYSVLIRNEIKDLLLEYSGDAEDPADDDLKLLRAEDMAISQIKAYISGRFDVAEIFTPYDSNTTATDTRNAFIVMTAIDCALYHLYSSLAPNKIPEHRSTRYDDALKWLRDVSRGDTKPDLPKIKDERGNDKLDFRLKSLRPPNNQKW